MPIFLSVRDKTCLQHNPWQTYSGLSNVVVTEKVIKQFLSTEFFTWIMVAHMRHE